MTEILGGLLMLGGGGGIMLSSAIHLIRSPRPNGAELVASLPFTPLPAPDAELDVLLASID